MPMVINRSTRNAIAWWVLKKVGDSLKLIMLILKLCFAVYVRVRELGTGNWRGARSVGFAKSGVCSDTSVKYQVEFFNVGFSSNSFNFQPMCGKRSTLDSIGDICFKEDEFLSCLSTFQSFNSRSSVDSFTSQFENSDYNFFPNILYMILISFVCIILTLLYESDQSHFVDDFQGQITSRMDKYIMLKVNFMLTGCLIILILTSASSFTNIKSEDCFNIYNPSSSYDDLCFEIQSCGANLCAVINPEDFFISNYRGISIFLAIMISVGLVTKWLVKRIDTTLINRVMTDTEHLDYMLRIQSMRWNRTLERLSQDEGSNPVSYLELSSHWKKLSEEEIKVLEEDCSICLCPLQTAKPRNPTNRDETINPSNNDGNTNRNQTYNRNRSNRPGYQNITGSYQRVSSQHRIHPDDFDRAFAFYSSDSGVSDDDDEHSIQPQERSSQASPCRQREIGQQHSAALEEASFALEEGNLEEGSTGLIEVVRVPCGHLFHAGCIEQWSSSNHVTCPVCRKNLRRPTPTAVSFSASTRRANEGRSGGDLYSNNYIFNNRDIRRRNESTSVPSAPPMADEESLS